MIGRPLTARQRDVLDVIRKYIAEHGYAPTARDLCKLLGVASTNGVNDFLSALEAKGYISRDARIARGMRLTPKARALEIERGAA